MEQEDTKKSLREVIYENDQCIKQANKQLERFDKLCGAISLNKGASTAVINNTSLSDPNLQEAHKRLAEMGFDLNRETKAPRKNKKRNRLNKVMHGKLRI